jgi:immunity protein 53 of polymorphic toxin system
MTSLERLENWYESHCNGDWEHQYGIKIGTLDNPGWRITFDLTGTRSEDKIFDRVELERTKNDWLQCWVDNDKFNAACGPKNLSEVINIFFELVDRSA